MNRWRLVAPALQLAAIVTLIALAINLWIQPLSYRTMRETLIAVRSDLASSVVRPGDFAHPAPGLTVYAQAMDDDGSIHNLFIYQSVEGAGATALTAREGRIGRRNGSPVLILRQGSNQQFNREGVLNFLTFDEYVLDLKPFMAIDSTVRYKLSDRYLHELFFPDLRQQWERENVKRMLAEGHSRLASPLYNMAFMAMALAAILGATFSRFGYGGRIAIAAFGAVICRVIGFGAQAASVSYEWANAAQYAVPLIAMTIAFADLFKMRLPAPKPRPVTARLAPRPA